MPRSIIVVVFVCLVLFVNASAQEPVTPWRSDPVFQRLSAALDRVPAIDMHTHLVQPGEFNPALGNVGPLMIRSSHPWLPSVIRKRFGVTVDPDNWPATVEAIKSARATMVKRLGEHGYWMDHLDYTGTDIALVNQYEENGTDGKRLRWVPHATLFLYPLPAEHLMARSPSHESDIEEAQKHLRGLFKDARLTEPPVSQLRSVYRHRSHIDGNWCALICDAAGIVEVDQPSRGKHESAEYFVIVRVVSDWRFSRYVR